MLKRIAIVAFFTGSGQLLSIFVLKFLSRFSDAEQLKAIAEIDSLVFFIMNVIALGLQSAAIRNLALSHEWKKEYHETQSARITLGILLMAGAALAFVNDHYILFFIAPILAWNGDYALYARGHAVVGSIVAFTRLAVPFLTLLLVDRSHYLAWDYLVSLAAVYAVTNVFISFFLGTSPFFKPSFKSLKLYFSTLPLGIVSVSLYFLGLGLILVIPYFYDKNVVATAFIGLKFYMIFKGVLRIIHQAFIKEMRSYEVCFKVDQLCTLIGLTFAAFPVCFPNTFINLFFGQRYLPDKDYFIVLAVGGLIYSLFSSLTTKAMLEKKDKMYAKVAGFSALLSIALTIVFSFSWPGVTGIGVSLLIGEVVFACGMIWLMQNPRILRERMVFMSKNIALSAIPLAVAYFMGDKMNAFWIALVPFGLIIILVYYNKFSLAIEHEPQQMQPVQNDSFLMRQSFHPGFASLFLNPLYLIRRRLFKSISQFAPTLQGRLLDFGCGRKPYQSLFRVTEYIGVDLEQTGHDHSSSRVDVYYDGKKLPFPDNSFDSLFCSEVIEHVFNAEEIIPELHRVLKPGATGLFTIPFCWNEHEVPFDYARYTSYGIKHLLEKHGFEVIELKKSGVFAQVMFQLWALYFWEVFSRWGRGGHILSLLFIVPTNIAGAVFGRILPKNNSLYFNNIVLVRKPQ